MVENGEPTPETGQPAQRPPDIEGADQSLQIPQNARNMALLCHLLGFLTCFIGPLIIWLIEKDKHDYINQQGKEALNFQITVMIASFAAGILSFACIGLLLFPVIGILDLVFCIMACIKSSKGEDYRYPISIRLVK